MEGGHTKAVDSSEQPTTEDVTGGGRSFDCIFCKRGFSNAQALGGHMNIHRKERARMKPENSATTSSVSGYCGAYGRNQSFPPMTAMTDYVTYLPESTSVQPRRRPQELRLFGPEAHEGDEPSELDEGERQASEVDLELRLGH